ncbi:MAG: hypothetical protein KQ78_01240 [Candidatus Izimaplasma bacterium HR2]|nr:MAG: hypothetical protein KQ78_01240 [Candidatus Izimaplasma bacterium HR2]
MAFTSIIEIDVIEDVYFYNLRSSKSPLLKEYYEQTDLWTLLYASIKNETLLKLMIFNMEFNITPVHTFIKYYEEELLNHQLTRFHKQCIGYHVSFLLATLGYKKTRQIYRKDAVIKYGAFYEKIAR